MPFLFLWPSRPNENPLAPSPPGPGSLVPLPIPEGLKKEQQVGCQSRPEIFREWWTDSLRWLILSFVKLSLALSGSLTRKISVNLSFGKGRGGGGKAAGMKRKGKGLAVKDPLMKMQQPRGPAASFLSIIIIQRENRTETSRSLSTKRMGRGARREPIEIEALNEEGGFMAFHESQPPSTLSSMVSPSMIMNDRSLGTDQYVRALVRPGAASSRRIRRGPAALPKRAASP